MCQIWFPDLDILETIHCSLAIISNKIVEEQWRSRWKLCDANSSYGTVVPVLQQLEMPKNYFIFER